MRNLSLNKGARRGLHLPVRPRFPTSTERMLITDPALHFKHADDRSALAMAAERVAARQHLPTPQYVL